MLNMQVGLCVWARDLCMASFGGTWVLWMSAWFWPTFRPPKKAQPFPRITPSPLVCLDYVTPPCCSDDSELDLLQRNRSGVASPKWTVLISKHTGMCLVYPAVQGGAVPARMSPFRNTRQEKRGKTEAADRSAGSLSNGYLPCSHKCT